MIPRHRPWEEAAEFTIGLKPISMDAWLEGGEADPASRKDPLFADRRGLVWAEAEGSRPAQAEAALLVEAALGAAPAPADLPPLFAAARRVADDLCLMEKRDGQWRLTALSLSAGSFFTAEEVIGRSLAELHGPVTGFAERLLVPRAADLRGPAPGAGAGASQLDGAEFRRTAHADLGADPRPHRRDRSGRAGRALSLRIERQTLRRLPQTGGALFTIRVWLAPLESLADDPARLAAFAHAWRTAHPDLRAYKRFDLYDDLVEGFLARAGVSPAH